MSRYIDADKEKEKKVYSEDRHEYVVPVAELDWLPTADVQEVMHGHWIEKALDNFRKVECSCSICGWSGVENYDSYVDIHDFEYCPYCGAKMDEEEKQ